MTRGPPGREHAASTRAAPTRADLRRGPPRWRGKVKLGQREAQCCPRRTHMISTWFSRWCGQHPPSRAALQPVVSGCERRPEPVPLRRRVGAAARRPRRRAFLDRHLVTFRVPELERWQHAAAAALVGARWGVAGLRTVIADTGAPLGRRYFAFLALAERHPEGAWPLFERYLTTPGAHHAFVAAAVEAARYYPGHADVLVRLFERIRGDQLLRRFLGPKSR